MNRSQLDHQIRTVERRVKRVSRRTTVSVWWFLIAVVAVVIWWTRSQFAWPVMNNSTLLFAFLMAACCALILSITRRGPSSLEIARLIEKQFPDLDDSLITAIEQRPELITGRLNFLQTEVIHSAIRHSRTHDWKQTIPGGRLLRSGLLGLLSLAAMAGSLVLVGLQPPIVESSPVITARGVVSDALDLGITVKPGDAEVERGTGLLVEARFGQDLPSDVTLLFEDDQNQTQQISMTQSLDDPIFAARIVNIRNHGRYRVIFGDTESDRFKVTVFDFPKLERSDAAITFPKYTGLPESTIEDTQYITVVEGSKVELICRVNKPLQSAELRSEKGDPITLTPREDDPKVLVASLGAELKQQYSLHLTDVEGRNNKFPPDITLDITRNRRPDLKLTFPGRDMRVSALEEVSLEARASDDFGLAEFGVIYGLAGDDPSEIVLGNNAPGGQDQAMRHLMSLEQTGAEPDELVSYYFFADDFGPDGQQRRTFSDMFFAEVRHFEEIFREGQQPAGGQQQQQQQGQQGQQTEKLAELQKQIINATWKLIRREAPVDPDKIKKDHETFGKDVKLVRESQQQALAQLEELAEKLQDRKQKGYAERIHQHMTKAIESLGRFSYDDPSESLPVALSSEQAAYQGLLKLRALEHQVRRSQAGGGQGSSSSGRSQQQLNQLELSNKENRYEQERQAAAQQQSSADREQLQILNRLKELARRQDAINEKLKELESELRNAKTEEERKEIERQLKRLRDEEQQMLRDLDELRNRMDQPQNQQQTAESRQQVERTRSQVRQASEALKEGQVSRALNAGTRAQRDLEEMRDDFRKKTAGQFSDEMREMRKQARDLANRQEELHKQLAENQNNRSLRYQKDREQIEQGLREQKNKLEGLVESMKQTVKKAEHSEPLLSKRLYDTIRKTRETQPNESLKVAAELLKRGFLPQAGEAEEVARAGIDSLKTGVEKAAESVLGDEVESLKRARRELEQLTRVLQGELAQADPRQQQGQQSEASPPAQSGQQPGEQQQGQRRTGSPSDQQREQSGQDPNGRRQQGQQQDGSGRNPDEQQPQNREGQQNGRQPGEQQQNGQQGPGQQNNRESGQQENQRNGQQGQRNGERQQQNGRQQGGQQQSQRQQPGGQQQQNGQQPSQGQQPSGQQQQGQQSGGQQQGGQQQGGQQQSGQQQGGRSNRNGNDQPGQRPERDQSQPGPLNLNPREGAWWDSALGNGPGGSPGGPLTGADFRDWSDRMRDVEEMVDDPDLQAEVARARGRARSMRVEFKRHSKEPNWELVRTSIIEPMVELQKLIAEEIAKRESPDSLVPIDRDPVPRQFEQIVREYYKILGEQNLVKLPQEGSGSE